MIKGAAVIEIRSLQEQLQCTEKFGEQRDNSTQA